MYCSKFLAALFIMMSLFTVRAFAGEQAGQTPWLNTNLIGAAKNYNPALKDDFYGSINHEWLVNAKLKPGYSRNAAFTELQDEIDADLRAIMTDENLTGHDAELVKNLYSIWLDWDKRNKNGLGNLPELIQEIESIKTLDDLSKFFMSETSFYHNLVIADFGLGLDNKDSESYNLELSPTGLSLGDSAEYKTLSKNGERTKKFNDSVSRYMLKRLGYDESKISEIIAMAFEFESKIAPSMMNVNELESPEAIEKTYNPLSIQELREKSKIFPYADIIESHSAKSNLMNLQQPEWLKALNDLYTSENVNLIKAYLIRNLANSYMGKIDEPAYRELQKLSNERSGITGNKPDNEIAADFVHGHLSVPLSKMYIAKYVSEATKQEIEQIIRDTVKFYREMLKSEKWLSEQTQAKAIEKLDSMRLNSAYPDKWVDYSELSINPNGTLIEALDSLQKFNVKKYFYERINTKVDHDLWISDIAVANAYYKPMENSINIIAGILGGDFYNPSMSYEQKLGGIGMVIGHEMSHAFDTRGAQFDKTGNMITWWTSQDLKNFQERANNLIKYLSSFKVDDSGNNYNGALVHTETIADMAGVKAMLGIAAQHKDFNYDKFFRQYAKIWKLIETRERMDNVLKFDVHALPYIRVNAIIQQYPEFYGTYDIKPGDGMYLAPESRVAVW
ncbi:MAG: M13 family metallopeptidase [Synergistaceae bacterium]|nr:M13 family metallopeptidase [Synergistaceae bacterium]